MSTALNDAMARLFTELAFGAPHDGSAFVLNSGDVGLLRSLDHLSAVDASASVHDGATIAAHARHLAYCLSLMNQWQRDGGNPFAEARWEEAWQTSSVNEAEWSEIRRALHAECDTWQQGLREPREESMLALSGMIGSIAHLAYHLGAIRQIDRSTRGPRDATVSTRAE
jgi:hypothetical protein